MSKSITVRIPENLFNQIDLLADEMSPFRPNLSRAILHLLSLGLAVSSKEPLCFSQVCFSQDHIVKLPDNNVINFNV